MLNRNYGRSRLVSGFVLASVIAVSLCAAKWVMSDLSNVTLGQSQIAVGSGTSATATVSPASAAVQVMKFTSSNTAVATVAASIPIPPGAGQATAPVIAQGPGCAMITATFNGRTRFHDLVVQPAAGRASFTMTVPNPFLAAPGNHTGKITLGHPSATGRISLVSSNPTLVTVPATVETVRGVAQFTISAIGSNACASITATMGTQSVKKFVMARYIGG